MYVVTSDSCIAVHLVGKIKWACAPVLINTIGTDAHRLWFIHCNGQCIHLHGIRCDNVEFATTFVIIVPVVFLSYACVGF